jgi:hypothetical protein
VQLGSTDKRVPDACGDFRLPAPRAKLRTQFGLEQTDGAVRTGPCECGATVQCRRAWPRRAGSPTTTTNEPDRRWFPTICRWFPIICGMADSTFSAFTRGFSCGHTRVFLRLRAGVQAVVFVLPDVHRTVQSAAVQAGSGRSTHGVEQEIDVSTPIASDARDLLRNRVGSVPPVA